jgi:predicted nucleic acid-binding protein
MTFVDSSALYAVLDHDDARSTSERLLRSAEILVTHNYVLVETAALVQSRLGMAAGALQDPILPVLRVYWVSESDHQTALEVMVAADRRRLSLVDCTSFLIMRSRGVGNVFCFDKHFQEQGFTLI